MDGTHVEVGPGEASFGNYQNSKPDAHGRKGHRCGIGSAVDGVEIIGPRFKEFALPDFYPSEPSGHFCAAARENTLW